MGPRPLFKRSVGETLYCMKCYRVSLKVAHLSRLQKTTVDINLFHQRLGHPSEYYTKKTAELNGMRLKGKMKVCEACSCGKGKQKPVKKFTRSRSNVPFERIFVDTSELPSKSLGGSRFWIMVVDDATGLKWSYFVKSKAELGDVMEKYISKYVGKYNIK